MRKAIETRYRGPTSSGPSVILASAEGVRTIAFDFSHAYSVAERHAQAAKHLAEKYGWKGLYVAGGNAKGNGQVFVNTGLQSRHDIAGHSCRFHPLGIEGEDWFFVGEPK